LGSFHRVSADCGCLFYHFPYHGLYRFPWNDFSIPNAGPAFASSVVTPLGACQASQLGFYLPSRFDVAAHDRIHKRGSRQTHPMLPLAIVDLGSKAPRPANSDEMRSKRRRDD